MNHHTRPSRSPAVRVAAVLFTLLLVAGAAWGQPFLNGDGPLQVSLVGETGFTSVLLHTITIGAGGTKFDYVRNGGQEILFPFSRYTAELAIRNRHTVIFLYQPLELRTQSRFDEDVTVDGILFQAGRSVDLTYSFPFYRVSYLYDFARSPRLELAAGLSLQLRNASIRFESTGPAPSGTDDDTRLAITQDLGPVPIVKVRAEYRFGGKMAGAFVGLEADGFYASSAFINGADFEFTGSIFDASLRAGFQPIPGLDVFANLRALGGGGSGTRPPENRVYWTQSQDGYTDNFLTAMSLTLGARVR